MILFQISTNSDYIQKYFTISFSLKLKFKKKSEMGGGKAKSLFYSLYKRKKEKKEYSFLMGNIPVSGLTPPQ